MKEMRKRYKITALIACLIFSNILNLHAQYLNSSYFMEGMTYRHELNPAFINESNYINLPFFVLGNFNTSFRGNIGMSDFLYPYNKNGNKLTTFMNPEISANEFLGNLQTNNHLNMDIHLPILAFGFRGFGGFNTFGIKLHSSTSFNLPYGLFEFLKCGMYDENGSMYHFDNLTIRSNNYVELALGHAREIIEDRLNVGAKIKFLVGAGYANAYINQMDIYMSQDEWKINADGRVEASVNGASFETKHPDEQGRKEVTGFNFDKPGIGGFGLAFDLGASYKLDDYVEGLTVSASILDLGFIKWNDGINARMQDEYTFTGFKNPISIDGEESSSNLEDELEQIGNDLEDFIKLYEEAPGGRTTKLAATMNIGAEYALPWYNKLRFGLLSSTHFNRPFTWSEARLSANIAPTKGIELSVNYAISSFGSSFGYVINFHPKGFNFFIGMDHLTTRFSPQFIPVNKLNVNLCTGFNITWGKK